MFEQTFENIDNILHKDAGCGSELDYVEQTSWILFLKYLEHSFKLQARLLPIKRARHYRYHSLFFMLVEK